MGQGNLKTEKYDFIEEELLRREKNLRLRKLKLLTPVDGAKVKVNGKEMLNFCSNDYLGLSKHPKIKERAAFFLEKYGAGSTGSRLITGTFDYMENLERKLANLKRTQHALIFNSGFQANVSILPALADKNTLILSDSLNHNSLIQGIRLARCKKEVFPHNDLSALQEILHRSQGKFSRRIIVSESVFSMDGDFADIDGLVLLSEKYQAFLMIDEAHATGVWGENGMGLCCGKNVDIVMGTFGKACGSFGAYVACQNQMADFLINCCAGFVYSTALPPAVAGAMEAALDLVPQMQSERQELWEKADFLRGNLAAMGFDTGKSCAQIIPVIVGDDGKTLDLASHLEKNHVLAMAIRPPTVEEGKSRIRLTLSAAHTWEHINELVAVFQTWQGNT